MCTNNDSFDYLLDENKHHKTNSQKPEILNICGDCHKCKKYAEIFYQLSYREAECRECFLIYVRHKFRATLGSNRTFPKNSQVLIVFDGSAESVMLLDIMHHSINQNQFKRLKCTTKVIFLDDALFNENINSDFIKLQYVKDFIASYEMFDSFLPTFNEHGKLINIQEIPEVMNLMNEENMNLKTIKTLTSKQDYIYEVKKRVALTAAKELDCQCVFVPDTSTILASRLLTSIALGRGGNTAMDIELIDEKSIFFNKIFLMRPMKDINIYEVNLYLHARNLNKLNIVMTPYGRQFGAYASLQNLTHIFLENLQTNSPSTVSTVYRTGTKICGNENDDKNFIKIVNGDNISSVKKCDLCFARLGCQSSKTLEAVEYSRTASEVGNTVIDAIVCKMRTSFPHTNIKVDNLCHGCRNIYNDNLSS